MVVVAVQEQRLGASRGEEHSVGRVLKGSCTGGLRVRVRVRVRIRARVRVGIRVRVRSYR